MKKLTILLLLSLLTLGVSAQTKLTAAQQKPIVDKIGKATSAMSSMQCAFTQEKSMKMLSKKMLSSGVMYYKQANKLRWQYTKPYDYTFILNGDKVRIKSAKTTKKINVQGDKMFRQVSNIILNTMTGGSLRSSADFTVEMYKTGNIYFARLYPKKKELKQIYKQMEIYFNPELTMVSSVKMEEKTGDVTVVKLSNVKTNVKIDEKMFGTD